MFALLTLSFWPLIDDSIYMAVCSLHQRISKRVINFCLMVLQVSFEMDSAFQTLVLKNKQLFLMLKVS